MSDTSASQQPSAPSALAFEQQVVDHVLAKLPKAPMDTDIPEQHNSRLSALESQVQLLTEQQASIHLSVQEHGLAQQAQISQLQHQFQAQHATLEHAVADQPATSPRTHHPVSTTVGQAEAANRQHVQSADVSYGRSAWSQETAL